MQVLVRALVLSAVMGTLGVAFADVGGQKSGKEMVQYAKNLINSGVKVIDVRQEACEGYVKGAQLVSVDDITNKNSVALKKIEEITGHNKSAKIAVYCRRGVRAEKAMGTLKELGYLNVQNIGGIETYYDDSEMAKCN